MSKPRHLQSLHEKAPESQKGIQQETKAQSQAETDMALWGGGLILEP